MKNKTQNNIQNKSQNNIQNKSQNIKNNKNIKNNLEQAKTSIMSLEKLKIEYSLQLNAYQQAIANYVNYLQQNANTDSSTPSLVTIPGKVFWGSGQTGNPSVSVGGTVEQCQALCSSTTNCSGATYNPTAYAQPMCWLRSGDSDITSGKESDYAIVSKGSQLLLIIQKINMRLSDINQQIRTLTQNNQEIYGSQTSDRKTNMAELARQYIQLNEEREKINNTINDYQTLDQQQIQGDLTANKNYYSFVLLLILAVVIIIALFMVGLSFNSQTNSSVLSGGAKGLKTIMSFRNK
jgi:hypothetical protein